MPAERTRSPLKKFHIVWVTAGSLPEARRLARAILQKKLAACVNLVPKVESWYWWRGKVEKGNEILLIIKTGSAQLKKLSRLVKSLHSYEVPEFLALPISTGDPAYLQWLQNSLESY